jgi:hypothetical protein
MQGYKNHAMALLHIFYIARSKHSVRQVEHEGHLAANLPFSDLSALVFFEL